LTVQFYVLCFFYGGILPGMILVFPIVFCYE
jgi:hypothetical protein